MTPVQALIFDLDGVITDTAEYHYLSWQRLATEEGLVFNREHNDLLRGLSRRASLDKILAAQPTPRVIDEATLDGWMTRKNGYYLEYLHTITPDGLLPGVDGLLDAARAAGISTGLASASRNARPVLEQLGITHKMDVIGDGHCVVNTKPAPDIFLWVAGRLDVYPGHAVVFEDAEAGIDAALAGGFMTVGLGTANVGHAQLHLPGLGGITLDDLLMRLVPTAG